MCLTLVPQTGIQTLILIPFLSLLSTASVPPKRSALSRIERNPKWPGKSPLISKPLPSSETSSVMYSEEHRILICTLLARACLTVLCNASWAMR